MTMRLQSLAVMIAVVLALVGIGTGNFLLAQTPVEEIFLLFPDISHSDQLQTGLAFANPLTGQVPAQAGDADLTLFFIDNSGTVVQGPGITNPASVSIPAGTQKAGVLPEFFGQGIIGLTGSVLVETETLSVVGFFLSFDPAVSMIDGADALVSPVIRNGNSFQFAGGAIAPALIFPEVLVGPGRTNRISVLAIGSSPSQGTLQLIRGGNVIEETNINFPGSQYLFSRFTGELADIFDTPLQQTDYVRAVAPFHSAIVGYQAFGGNDFTAGRNAVSEPLISNSIDNSSFGAQLALTPAINTSLKAVNPTNSAMHLTIEAFPTGAPAAAGEAAPAGGASATREVVLDARSALREDLSSFLGLSDFVGWLKILSDRTGLIANASFGDRANKFFSSVQLQASPQRELVNSHVANGLGFGTGVTFLNPEADPVDVDIDVFDKEGNRTGGGSLSLQGFEHQPLLLTDIDPSLGTQVNGDIAIKATHGIFSFELFFFIPPGTSSIAALSAVPPQRGNGIVEGTISPVTEQSISAVRAARSALAVSYPASARKGVRLDPNWDFMPGQIIVKLREDPGSAAQQELFSSLNLRVHREAPDRVLLLESGEIVSPEGADFLRLQSTPRMMGLKLGTLDLIERLNSSPEVKYAEPNYISRTMAVPNDPLWNLQWHYPFVNFPAAWEITKGDPNLVVAVIDTGAKFAHPDLSSRLTGGQYDFIDDPQNSGDGDGIDGSAEDPGDDPMSPSYHGTHVAGTIGAATNNGIGVAGGNWNSPIMMLRTCGLIGCLTFDNMQAARFAAGLPNVSGMVPGQAGPQGATTPASVINMSLGSQRPCSQFEADNLGQVMGQGVSVVASAGNDNTSDPASPASCPGVISVLALARTGKKAPYSNFGPTITVSAPGGDLSTGFFDGVLSTFWDRAADAPDYTFYQGTSMAAPHVTAIVSLMLSVNPALSPPQVKQILETTAVDLGPPGKDDQSGFGQVDALAAVAAAAGAELSDPILFVNTSLLDFGNDLTSLEVVVQNVGGGTLTVNSITPSTDSGGAWLSVNQSPTGGVVPEGASASFFAHVDRSGLADGEYTGQIQIMSNGGSTNIDVQMLVGLPPIIDVGDIAVIAIEPRTFMTIGGASVGAADSYAYRFQVPAGEYNILAGTDEDGDSIICEDADLCGWFPVSNSPSDVLVRAGIVRSNLNFIVQPQGDFNLAVIPGVGHEGIKLPSSVLAPVKVEATYKRQQ